MEEGEYISDSNSSKKEKEKEKEKEEGEYISSFEEGEILDFSSSSSDKSTTLIKDTM